MSALRWTLQAVHCLALQLTLARSVRLGPGLVPGLGFLPPTPLGHAAELQELQALQTSFAVGARHTAARP